MNIGVIFGIFPQKSLHTVSVGSFPTDMGPVGLFTLIAMQIVFKASQIKLVCSSVLDTDP